jgi:hypothetical protein
VPPGFPGYRNAVARGFDVGNVADAEIDEVAEAMANALSEQRDEQGRG